MHGQKKKRGNIQGTHNCIFRVSFCFLVVEFSFVKFSSHMELGHMQQESSHACRIGNETKQDLMGHF